MNSLSSLNNQANTVDSLNDKLSLNVNKTKAIIFHMPQKKVPNN